MDSRMDRRRFLVGVLATGAAAVGASALRGAPAYGSTGATSASSAERFLLGTARRALA